MEYHIPTTASPVRTGLAILLWGEALRPLPAKARSKGLLVPISEPTLENKQAGAPPIDALFWTDRCAAEPSPLGLRQAMPKVHFSICAPDALTKSKM